MGSAYWADVGAALRVLSQARSSALASRAPSALTGEASHAPSALTAASRASSALTGEASYEDRKLL